MQTAHTACRCCRGLGQECKYNTEANRTCKHKIHKETHFTRDKGCQPQQMMPASWAGHHPSLPPSKRKRMAHLCRQPTGKQKLKPTEINQSSFTSMCLELDSKTTHPSDFCVVWATSPSRLGWKILERHCWFNRTAQDYVISGPLNFSQLVLISTNLEQ